MTNEQINQLREERLKQNIIKMNKQEKLLRRHKPLRPVKSKPLGEIDFGSLI